MNEHEIINEIINHIATKHNIVIAQNPLKHNNIYKITSDPSYTDIIIYGQPQIAFRLETAKETTITRYEPLAGKTTTLHLENPDLIQQLTDIIIHKSDIVTLTIDSIIRAINHPEVTRTTTRTPNELITTTTINNHQLDFYHGPNPDIILEIDATTKHAQYTTIPDKYSPYGKLIMTICNKANLNPLLISRRAIKCAN